ncbi:MAG: ATP-binding protein [Planctomycetota bacterium]
MDFLTERELTAQIGHNITEWPLVVLKELIDNALDACEEAGIPPEIAVTADAAGLSVEDNGPGIPDSTIQAVLDFSVRVSSREAYIGPTRGTQGHALKTLATMPYVVDPQHGRLIVQSCGQRRTIRCAMDPVTRRAIVHCDPAPCNGAPGTVVRVEWAPRTNADGDVVWPFDEYEPVTSADGWCPPRDRATALLRGFALFNPHLTLSVDWFGKKWIAKATDPGWRKWRPDHPTNPHWYERQHFERLIGAYIAADQDRGSSRTVAAFLAEFDGLTGSIKRKRVLDEVRLLKREPLTILTDENGFRGELVEQLLVAMKKHSRPVKPSRLGTIGEEHLRARFQEWGCDPKQFQYRKRAGTEEGLPYILETAFAYRGEDAPQRREIFAGANWSAAIKNPFRAFGATGQGLEAHLTELKAGADEPILFALHLAHPRIQFADRGKSSIIIGSDSTEEDEQ